MCCLLVHILCSCLLKISPKLRTVEPRSYLYILHGCAYQKGCACLGAGKSIPISQSQRYTMFGQPFTFLEMQLEVGVIAFHIVTFIYTSLIIKKAGHLFPCIGSLQFFPQLIIPVLYLPFYQSLKAKFFIHTFSSTYALSTWVLRVHGAGIGEALIYSQKDFGNVLPG